MTSIQRRTRAREQSPRSVPWALDGKPDVVAVDTTGAGCSRSRQPRACEPWGSWS